MTSQRRIEVRLYRFGDVATNTHEGIREQLLPGVFAGTDPTGVRLESTRHGGAIVGVAEELVERDGEIRAVFRVAETAAGDELLALASPGPNGEPAVLRDASVVFRPTVSRPGPGGIVQRVAAELRRVAILERGAYASAQVLAVRGAGMSDEITLEPQATPAAPTMPPAPAVPAPAPAPAVQLVQRAAHDELTGRVDGIEERVARIMAGAAVPGGASSTPHPLAGFGTLAEYATEVYRGNADQGLLARALAEYEVQRLAADQITDNNAGVVPPSWLTDVKRIVDLGRRVITAFGGPQSLGETGMEIDWPYLSSSNTLIAAQPTGEKNEVQSARVDIAKGSSSLLTYAGYSDISYQLLQRSSPSYREAYDRILLAAWGAVTDAAFAAAIEGTSGTTTQAARGMLGADIALANPSAAADDILDTSAAHGLSIGDAVVFTALTGGTGLTAGRVYWVISSSFAAQTFQVSATPGGAAVDFSTNITAGNVAKVTDTGLRLREALAQASVSIEDATGQPASVALAGTDMFLMLAGLSGLVTAEPATNPSNAIGTLMASTLTVQASGLVIRRAPGVSNGKLLLSNQLAAAWHEDGPRFATTEDVAKLGQNVGVYSFAAPAVYAPAGVVELTLI